MALFYQTRRERTIDVEQLLGFMLAGLALAGSPGPATLSLAATGAAFGARRGFGYLTGLVIGMVAVMVITASGAVGVVLAVPGATPVVTGLAALYFAYLAYRIAAAPPLSEPAPDQRPPSFAGGVLLSLVNPKGYAAMAALFSSFVLGRERVVAELGIKIVVLTAIITAVSLAWLYTGAALTRWFRDPATNRAINGGFAVLLVVSVVLALLV
jgi:threonine/homoserine/homoserine lactone efflux protein